jgi:hypothetical protein
MEVDVAGIKFLSIMYGKPDVSFRVPSGCGAFVNKIVGAWEDVSYVEPIAGG